MNYLDTAIICFLAGAFTFHFSNTNNLHLFYIFMGISFIIYVFYLKWYNTNSLQQHTEDNDSTEHNELKTPPAIFYFVYAPWCGHSRRAKVVWEKLEEKNKNREDITFTILNSENEEDDEIINELKITSFPQFFIDDKESLHYYNDERTTIKMQQFIDNTI